jgi:hypothetical protein
VKRLSRYSEVRCEYQQGCHRFLETEAIREAELRGITTMLCLHHLGDYDTRQQIALEKSLQGDYHLQKRTRSQVRVRERRDDELTLTFVAQVLGIHREWFRDYFILPGLLEAREHRHSGACTHIFIKKESLLRLIEMIRNRHIEIDALPNRIKHRLYARTERLEEFIAKGALD